MKIRDIDLGPRPLILAPMEDVTDIGFRRMCKAYGAAMVYSEFVAAEALVRNVGAAVRKLRVADDERPVAIQIYGRTVEAVVEAARIVEGEAHPDTIDLNFGCPVKKVAGKGAGAGMLRTPDVLLHITEAVVQAVHTPVTVKTRLGWDSDHIIIDDLAPRLEACGIAALAIHGRTRGQMYTGVADWEPIGRVARRLTIPVIGNGDITSRADADAAFDRYGVAGVMIGRATFGQPWIFSPRAGQMTAQEKVEALLRLLDTNIELIGDERRAVLHTRRHLAATPIFKGIPDFRPTRIAMLRADTAQELREIIRSVRIGE